MKDQVPMIVCQNDAHQKKAHNITYINLSFSLIKLYSLPTIWTESFPNFDQVSVYQKYI